MLPKINLEWISEWTIKQKNYDLYTTATKICKNINSLFWNCGVKWLDECMGVWGGGVNTISITSYCSNKERQRNINEMKSICR